MKTYVLNFASANSTLTSGLAPTMVMFAIASTGATLVAPGISESPTGWGLYTFQWGTTTAIVFLCDGATSGLGNFRYIKGSLDPADRADEYGNTLTAIGLTLTASLPAGLGQTIVAIGNTSIALGTSNLALGTTNVALGTTNVAIGTTIYALEQSIGTSIIAMGTTIAGIGTSLSITIPEIGTVGSTFGGSGSDPIDLFGYLKRIQENLEGNSTYVKQTGVWDIYSRGSSSLLIAKTITNGTSTVSKS